MLSKLGVQWRVSMLKRYIFYFLNFSNYMEIILYERKHIPFTRLITRDGLLIQFDDCKTAYIVMHEIWRKKTYTQLYNGVPCCVVDIGANVGFFTLFAARKWPLTQIISYEPSKRNFGLLQANIQGKYSGRITVFNAAVADENGTAELRLRSSSGLHSFFEKTGGKAPEETEIVSVVSIKSLLSHLEYVDFMKIDCEGCEWLLFQERNVPWKEKVGYLAMEYHRIGNHKAEELVSALTAQGFDVITEPPNCAGENGMLYAKNTSRNF